MIAIGLQLVGLNSKFGRSTVTLSCLSCDRDAFDERRQRVARDGHRRRVRVDVDARAHIDIAEVERARDRRRDDHRPKRRAPYPPVRYTDPAN